MTTQLSNKWKRFSLRSLFILMTACCLLFGIWAAYVSPYRKQARSLAEVYSLNGRATTRSASGPGWQRWLVTTLLGDDAFVHVIDVELQGLGINDAALQSLVGLAHLRTLSIAESRISDKGIFSLSALKELQSLSLRYANISDGSIETLSSLPALETLHLTGTKISDASIPELVKLSRLSEIFIRWTNITADGAQRLAANLPECAVHHHALE